MTVTMFTGTITAHAAIPSPIYLVGTGTYGSYKVSGFCSKNSTTHMSGKAISNAKATRIATTIVVRNVDSKGNVKPTGGNPDQDKDNATDSGIADITSGSGNNFKWIKIYYAGMYNNNLDQIASTIYNHTF